MPRVAFSAVVGTSDEGVYVVSADGATLRRLTSPGLVARNPVWAPDGTQLAFAGGPDANHLSIWAMQADGTGMRQLAQSSPSDDVPTWSPDGSEVAFAAESPTPQSPTNGDPTASVMAVNADGTGLRALATLHGESFFFACGGATLTLRDLSWSPGGASLLVAADEVCGEDAATGTFLVAADGSGARLLPAEQAFFFSTSWSADGTQMVFASPPTQTSPIRLTIADAAGRPVSTLPVFGWPLEGNAWSPTGAPIAYEATVGDHVDLRSVSPDGSADRLVSSPAPGDTGAWLPPGQGVVVASRRAGGEIKRVRLDGSAPFALTSLHATSYSNLSVEPTAQRRLAGADRIATAVDVSRATFTSAPAVVVARADTYPDALAAAPLAASVGGPLLLTPADHLAPADRAEIMRLGAHSAYIVGTTDAVSAQVETDLLAAGVADVHRIGGTDRFDTARLIAAAVGGTNAYLVQGIAADAAHGWPDAIAVAALAAAQRRPVLLTTTDTLPAATTQALSDNHIDTITIVGGTAAVSDAVAQDVARRKISVSRVAGGDRYDTSVRIVNLATASGLSASRPWLVTGLNWPDALGAGPAAAADGAVLLLVDPTNLNASQATGSWIAANGPSFSRVTATGGPDVLSARDSAQALAAEGGP